MSLSTLQAGLALLTADYAGADDDGGACGRALQLGDRNLADAAALVVRVEARADALALELFLANVRKCLKLRNRLPDPAFSLKAHHLYSHYADKCEQVFKFAETVHDYVQQHGGVQYARMHRAVLAVTTPQPGSSPRVSFQPGLLPPPAEGHRRNTTATSHLSLSSEPGPSANWCSSPFHGLFQGCPCTTDLPSAAPPPPAALPLPVRHSEAPTDVSDAQIISTPREAAHATPAQLVEVRRVLRRTLASIRRALSARRSNARPPLHITRVGEDAAYAFDPAGFAAEPESAPAPGAQARLAAGAQTRSASGAQTGFAALEADEPAHTVVSASSDEDEDGDGDEDEDAGGDSISVRWYKLVEVQRGADAAGSGPARPSSHARAGSTPTMRAVSTSAPQRSASVRSRPAPAPEPEPDTASLRAPSLRRTASTRTGMRTSLASVTSVRRGGYPTPAPSAYEALPEIPSPTSPADDPFTTTEKARVRPAGRAMPPECAPGSGATWL